MGRKRENRFFACDFETTVYDNQTFTEAWSAAVVEMYTEDVSVFHSVGDMMDYFFAQPQNIIGYFHNLKFDGTFIITWLLDHGFKQAYIDTAELTGSDEHNYSWTKKMRNGEFQYLISSKGQWYTLKIRKYDKMIEFRDSLKLFPFKLEEVGIAFQTKHRKSSMEYRGLRYAGCRISDEEMEYIKNDVLVLKEALEFMFYMGHDKLTIGSCCMSEFRDMIGDNTYKYRYPDLYKINIDHHIFGYETAGEYILKSYRGGWCYLVPEKANRIFTNGVTADVNSLYPSMMHSESGNRYPYGDPVFWSGPDIPPEAMDEKHYFFIRIRTRFYIKDGYLPFIQIKGTFMYRSTECLKTSDYHVPGTDKYYKFYRSPVDHEIHDTRLTMTMTQTDYELFLEHYNVEEFEILDGCYFKARPRQFDDYIDKYKQIKMTNKGAMRTLAKLFLNNLYGKFASTPNSSFKICYENADGSLNYIDQLEYSKEPGYIAVGSAVTSYARAFTIRAAQKNYHGPDKPGFIYADTDSIHCDLDPKDVQGITVSDTEFCCWKLESSWSKAIFVRQKTYIEYIVAENLKPITNPYHKITCAGMSDKCKVLLNSSLTGEPLPEGSWREEEIKFAETKRELTDFKVGLKVPGKLIPKRIPGGTILVDDYFTMRY